MENKLEIFSNSELGSVRMIMIEDEPHFVAKDVCEILGIKDHTTSIRSLREKKERVVLMHPLQTNGGTQNINILTEQGLYLLIAQSNRTSNKKKEELIKLLNLEDKFYLPTRQENEFFDKLEEVLIPFGYKVDLQYRVLTYLLDGYIKELNLVIEYDEKQHRTPKGKVEDKLREDKIKEVLGCEFVRLDNRESHLYNVGLVMKTICSKQNKGEQNAK